MPRAIIVRRSPIHGTGVFAARPLAAGTTIIRYGGQLLTHEEADRLYAGNADTGHTFLFTLNDDYVIDGASRGNAARWINHSCEPNCEAVLYEDEDGDRSRDYIAIETLRPIRRGEELTYDYGLVLDVRHTRRMKQIWACHCGAKTCTGTLLKDKRRVRR
jgi:SET domain-containing protein